jgi:hypothetical protein
MSFSRSGVLTLVGLVTLVGCKTKKANDCDSAQTALNQCRHTAAPPRIIATGPDYDEERRRWALDLGVCTGSLRRLQASDPALKAAVSDAASYYADVATVVRADMAKMIDQKRLKALDPKLSAAEQQLDAVCR